MDEVLDERKRKILKAIIKTYMETGEPVGSRTISKYPDLNVSSATIRNEMSDLKSRRSNLILISVWLLRIPFVSTHYLGVLTSMFLRYTSVFLLSIFFTNFFHLF